MPDESPKRKLAHSLGWMDAKFWQDVVGRVVSTVIAAGVIYLFAVGFGYVQEPSRRRVVVSTAVLLVAIIAMRVIVVDGLRLVEKKWGNDTAFTVAACALLGLFGLAFLSTIFGWGLV